MARTDTYPLRCGSQFSFQRRRDAGSDRFDGSHKFCVWQRCGVHLKREPGDPAQRFTVSKDLLGDFLGIANQQRAVRPRCASNPARITGGQLRSFPTSVTARASASW